MTHGVTVSCDVLHDCTSFSQSASFHLPCLSSPSPRSRIHGLGLYARRPIEAGDMVVEYTGTVIRSCLTDKREKYYDRKVCACTRNTECSARRTLSRVCT